MSRPDDEEDWKTVREAALLCHRTPKTIRNLIYQHRLRHERARGDGGHPRHILYLPPRTVQRLKDLTWRRFKFTAR